MSWIHVNCEWNNGEQRERLVNSILVEKDEDIDKATVVLSKLEDGCYETDQDEKNTKVGMMKNLVTEQKGRNVLSSKIIKKNGLKQSYYIRIKILS